MKKGRSFGILCLLACLSVLPAFAQDDYALFREEAGGASLLYRGQKAFVYNMLFNGTYYWSSPVFSRGEVRYNDNVYHDVLLNIDAVRQDLLVRQVAGIGEKVLTKELVEECTFGGDRYLNLKFFYGEDAPEGYWKVLYDEGRAKMLVQVRKILEQDVENRRRGETGYDGPYRLNVYQVFTYRVAYLYVTESGDFVRIHRRSDLLRQFAGHDRRDIRRHVRHLDGAGFLSLDRYCIEALKYAESR